ncbi:hypothetical protein D3C85_1018870 [compost metagenome]
MAFWEAVTAKTFQLLEHTFGKIFAVAFTRHAIDKLFFKLGDHALGFKGGHAPPKFIGFCRGKACSYNCNFHGLFLKQGYSKRAVQDFFELF